MRRNTGIQVRHRRGCPTGSDPGARCKCSPPSFRAEVWDPRAQKMRQSFPTFAAAKAWRQDALVALRNNKLHAADPITLRQAAKAWLDGAEAGTVRTRSGDAYKPSVIRSYRSALDLRLLPALGAAKLGQIQRRDVQNIADDMLAEGASASTIRNGLMPLRVTCRRALEDGDIAVNPCMHLRLPAVRGVRDRIASPDEAAKLLAALPEADRALWATAMYAGLRRGELLALRFEDVDLHRGVIRVERSWDVKEGAVSPKSSAGTRTVPIASVLREHLAAHLLRVGRREGLVFGRSATTRFSNSSARKQAATAWRRPKLEGIGMHECRHTFASLMIAAGVNAKALSTYLGHSSITITYDRYGHLIPGSEEEAAGCSTATSRGRQRRSATDERRFAGQSAGQCGPVLARLRASRCVEPLTPD